MASTYTGLGVQLMETGEKAGTWGTLTNTNWNIIEQISGGYVSIACNTSGATTLAVSDGAATDANQVGHRVINLTAALAGNITVTIPLDVQQLYIIKNATTNAYTVQFKYVSGSGSSVTWGTTDKGTKIIYATANDGTNPDIVDTGFLSSVVDDTSPQLGGNLDCNGNDIVSTSDADIDIIPNGTGDVNLGADTVQVGDNNANATLTTQGTGDLILNTNNGSSSGDITLLDGANGNIEFTNNGTGVVKFNDAAYFPEAALAFDATQDWDVQASPVAKVTLTDNVTFDAPSNPTTGQFISILCIQDNTGSRTIAWDGVFEFASGAAPTATTTADKGDLFSFRYNGAKWLCVGTTLALTLS